MPCYLFTYHTYGSWLPDRKQGFVLRGEGVQPTNATLAKTYRNRMKQPGVTLTNEHQLTAINAIRNAAECLACRLHFVATESNHVHLLTSWQSDKTWQSKRNSYKRAITLALKSQHEKRTWLSEGSSRRRVRDRKHFEHLVNYYLPRHRGWKWGEVRGLHK